MVRSNSVKSGGRVIGAGKGKVSRARTNRRSSGVALRARHVIGGAVVLAVLSGLFERFIWLGAVAREWAALLAALCLFLAVVAAIERRWRWTTVLVAGSLIAIAPAWSLLRPVRLTPEKGPVLRVAEATLAGLNVEQKRLSDLRDGKPDLLAVVGATDATLRLLDTALPELPYRARKLGPDGKQALWSRLPLRGVSHAPVARIRVGKCDVQLLVMSVPSRLRFGQQPQRKRAVQGLAQTDDSARAIWLGSLGSRPQAQDLTDLTAAQRLRDTRLGHGLLASTPTWLGPFGVSQDHVLVRGWIAIRERSVREALADGAHATQLATLELTEPRCR